MVLFRKKKIHIVFKFVSIDLWNLPRINEPNDKDAPQSRGTYPYINILVRIHKDERLLDWPKAFTKALCIKIEQLLANKRY